MIETRRLRCYADESRSTSDHDIRSGDVALVRQRRRNNFSTPFESTPYVVARVKGTIITTRRRTDQRQKTRNSSTFKKIEKFGSETNYQLPWNIEDEAEVRNIPKSDESPVLETEVIRTENPVENFSQGVDNPPAPRRSGRSRKKPVWLKE